MFTILYYQCITSLLTVSNLSLYMVVYIIYIYIYIYIIDYTVHGP